MKTYATKSQQARLDRWCMGSFLDLDCYLEPGTKDWIRWICDTQDYRSQTKEGRMSEFALLESIKIVKRHGPEDTSIHTLAQALGCTLEYRGHHCYIDGMRRTWEQAHKHLIALWRLSNDT